jgi:ubiquinone/menaquinone biosynthesis C-methylase UbiE
MSTTKHDGFLGAVYESKSTADVASLYDKWAKTYDAEMAAAGYRHPSICLALLSRHLPKTNAPILDAGAGTGLIGEWLQIMGYLNVEALDISKGMLAVAATKNCYSNFHQHALGTTLPFPTAHYAGVISSGVFTSGHVGAEGLDELIRITKPGGVIVLTVKDTLWNDGFEKRVVDFERDGKIKRTEETNPYISMPGEKGTTPSRGLVLQVMQP